LSARDKGRPHATSVVRTVPGAPSLPRRRCVPVTPLMALALLLGGCGDDRDADAPRLGTSTTSPAVAPAQGGRGDLAARIPIAGGVRQRVLGRGARTVTILEPSAQGAGPRPVVVFLHGWGALSPSLYGPWLVHLVRGGQTVVYPRYQDSVLTDPTTVLATTVLALRTAFRVAPPAAGTLVVAGHSAGGALSADVAAVARGAGLPRPVGVFAVYPGRRLRGVRAGVPAIGLTTVPHGTDVVALGSARDDTVGTAEARRIGRLGRYVAVTDPRAGEHRAPLSSAAVARRVFWAPLDRLIRDARRA
jgi:acetyl esterase/lipase